jgi:hypothetical protein
VLSVVLLIAVAVLHSRPGTELWLKLPEARAWLDLARDSGVPLLAGMGLLGLSIVCLLLGRRSGGAVHVLRGALGWSLAGFLGLLVVRMVPELEASGRGGHLQLSPMGLVVIAGLGALSLGLIAWPRPRVYSEESRPPDAVHREPAHLNH